MESGGGRSSASSPAEDDGGGGGAVTPKPGFLQPAYPDLGGSLGSSLGRQRPPRLPSGGDAPGRGSPELFSAPRALDPQKSPHSSRASTPRRRVPSSPSGGERSPRGSSRGASSTGAPSSSGSAGLGLTGTVSPAGTTSRPGTGSDLDPEAARRQEMLMQGYLPTEDYFGIMSLNNELREQNKRLRAEFVSLQVEHQRLSMEESFLRESVLKASLEPPPEAAPRTPGAGLAVPPPG